MDGASILGTGRNGTDRGNDMRGIRGFTLIELMVVVAIVAIIAAIAVRPIDRGHTTPTTEHTGA